MIFSSEYTNENYTKMNIMDILKSIKAVEAWDCIDKSVYVYLCSEVGLNYENYDDPDFLFDDILKKVNERR